MQFKKTLLFLLSCGTILSTTPVKAEVALGNLNVRDSASEDGNVISCLEKDNYFTILDQVDDYYYIESGGVTGYVNAAWIDEESENSYSDTADIWEDNEECKCGCCDFLNEEEIEIEENSNEEDYEKEIEPEEDMIKETSIGNSISSLASNYLGNAYVWGGTSPGGFDCSGLVQYVHFQNGISTPRVASDQYAGGTKISIEEAVATPGALLFYHDFGHVAISNGDGTVTHASTSTTGVINSDANYSTPCGAVKYF